MSSELNNNSFKTEFKLRCFKFSLGVIRLVEVLREKQLNRVLVDQLMRSGTSIGANIVEGGNSSSRREFINYFQIAVKSASETAYWLSLLKEINGDRKYEITGLIDECVQIKKITIRIILNTKGNSKL